LRRHSDGGREPCELTEREQRQDTRLTEAGQVRGRHSSPQRAERRARRLTTELANLPRHNALAKGNTALLLSRACGTPADRPAVAALIEKQQSPVGERAVPRRAGDERFASGAVVRASMALTPALDEAGACRLSASETPAYSAHCESVGADARQCSRSSLAAITYGSSDAPASMAIQACGCPHRRPARSG
jgi:hypothetical protein